MFQDLSIMPCLFLIICTFVSTRGTKQSSVFNSGLTFMKLAIIVLIIGVAFTEFNIQNFTPFFLDDKGGIAGTLQATMILSFAYVGFDQPTSLTDETKYPKRDIPRSMNYTVGICILLYTLVAVSMSGMMRFYNF